jgi:hypothetical protein
VPWEKIEPYVEKLLSPQAYALLIAKPDQRKSNGAHAASQPRDNKGRLLPLEEPKSERGSSWVDLLDSSGNPKNRDASPDSPGDQANRDRAPGHDKETKIRAILRAPQPVQQLYRDGLIAQEVAAKLGPYRPTPNQVTSIVLIQTARCVTRDVPAAR